MHPIQFNSFLHDFLLLPSGCVISYDANLADFIHYIFFCVCFYCVIKIQYSLLHKIFLLLFHPNSKTWNFALLLCFALIALNCGWQSFFKLCLKQTMIFCTKISCIILIIFNKILLLDYLLEENTC